MKTYLEVGLRPERGLGPGGRKGFVDILGGVEVQAQSSQVSAQCKCCEVWIAHPDHTQQAQQTKPIRHGSVALQQHISEGYLCFPGTIESAKHAVDGSKLCNGRLIVAESRDNTFCSKALCCCMCISRITWSWVAGPCPPP